MTRLFWKIFGWLFIVNFALATLFFVLSGERFSVPQTKFPVEKIREIQQQRLLAVSYLIEFSGVDAAKKYLTETPDNRLKVWVADQQGADILNRNIPFFIKRSEDLKYKKVMSPSKQQYDVFTYMPPLDDTQASLTQQFPRLARPLFYFFGSLFACLGLAWYLTRPIKLLSESVQKVATGKYEAVQPKLGLRRDELVTLAGEFDHMADEIWRNQQALKQVLSDVSHELRSPLTRVKLSLGLLEQQQQKMTPQNLSKIMRELDRLDELINQVLTIAQLDNVPTHHLDDYVELRGLLSSIVDSIDIELREKSCSATIQTVDTQDELVMQGNQELLYRAFENIIRNALKFSPDNSQIDIEIFTRDTQVHIQVTDNGPGIPANEIDNIFTPFYRLDAARHTKGFGLGLTICKQAIEYNKGEVSAHNGEKGLIVEVSFPISGFQNNEK